tara:strand:+ start:6394 stop:6840 length:447 start_codon:yes stop_codon:yes gene_type:complete
MRFLSNDLSVYIFYFTVSIFGWISSLYNKNIVKKISPTTFSLFSSIISLLSLTVLSFYQKINPLTELSKLTINELSVISLSALLVVVFRVVGMTLLKYHKVETIQLAAYIISMVVNGAATYVVGNKKLTIGKLVAFLAMAIGGYVFTN